LFESGRLVPISRQAFPFCLARAASDAAIHPPRSGRRQAEGPKASAKASPVAARGRRESLLLITLARQAGTERRNLFGGTRTSFLIAAKVWWQSVTTRKILGGPD